MGPSCHNEHTPKLHPHNVHSSPLSSDTLTPTQSHRAARSHEHKHMQKHMYACPTHIYTEFYRHTQPGKNVRKLGTFGPLLGTHELGQIDERLRLYAHWPTVRHGPLTFLIDGRFLQPGTRSHTSFSVSLSLSLSLSLPLCRAQL